MKIIIYGSGHKTHLTFIKNELIRAITESASCVVIDYGDTTECIKNRCGFKTMDCCEGYDFEKIKISELNGNKIDISKRYYGKNVWLLVEE